MDKVTDVEVAPSKANEAMKEKAEDDVEVSSKTSDGNSKAKETDYDEKSKKKINFKDFLVLYSLLVNELYWFLTQRVFTYTTGYDKAILAVAVFGQMGTGIVC